MKISITEFERFLKLWATDQTYEHQRFGQAWYNYFKLHDHTGPADKAEQRLLDSIYNAPNDEAKRLIMVNFIDYSQ